MEKFETDGIELFHADCLLMLRSLPDESVDMVFADPPFNVDLDYKDYADKLSDERYRQWCIEWMSECFRILKPTGTFYLMTIDRHLEWKMPFMASKGVFINLVKWRNKATNCDQRRFWNITQPIMVYGKTENYKFNPLAQVRPESLTAKGAPSRWGNDGVGRLLDYWDDIPLVYSGSIKHPEVILEPGTNKKAHKCQMPEMLAGRAILFSTDEGDVVVDPFTGSGTTLVAARKLNRLFKGSEKGAGYFNLIKSRYTKENGKLFF